VIDLMRDELPRPDAGRQAERVLRDAPGRAADRRCPWRRHGRGGVQPRRDEQADADFTKKVQAEALKRPDPADLGVNANVVRFLFR
jgi:hypothetical protein